MWIIGTTIGQPREVVRRLCSVIDNGVFKPKSKAARHSWNYLLCASTAQYKFILLCTRRDSRHGKVKTCEPHSFLRTAPSEAQQGSEALSACLSFFSMLPSSLSLLYSFRNFVPEQTLQFSVPYFEVSKTACFSRLPGRMAITSAARQEVHRMSSFSATGAPRCQGLRRYSLTCHHGFRRNCPTTTAWNTTLSNMKTIDSVAFGPNSSYVTKYNNLKGVSMISKNPTATGAVSQHPFTDVPTSCGRS